MNDDGKDNETRDAVPAVGSATPGTNPHGARRVPGAYLYPRAVLVELGERLQQRIGPEFRRLGDTLCETGRLLPEVDGSSAVLAISGLRIEIRHLRDLLTDLENNL